MRIAPARTMIMMVSVLLAACKSDTTARVTVSGVAVSLATPTVLTGQTTTATAVVSGSNGSTLTDRSVTWQSSSPAIATVSGTGASATVTAIAPGTAAITATSEGTSGSVTLTVNVPPNALTDLSITPTTATLQNPAVTQSITTTPVLAGAATVSFANSSSNPAVATVVASGANPIVTAVAAGTAIISVAATGSGAGFTSNSITRTVSITVTPTATVQLALGANTVSIGANTQATATPKDAAGVTLANRTVSAWSSSNATVATVNQTTGVVTAVSAGVTTISATIEGQVGSAQLVVCQAQFAPPASGVRTVFVSATSGNDATGTGSCAAPYKTVSKGVVGATSGSVIRAGVGTYDATLGETFPIVLPPSVSLVGDETNRGQGTTGTKISGDGALTFTGQLCGTYSTTVYAGANSTIAGFELNDPIGLSGHMTMVLRTDSVTIRNNTITGQNSGGAAIYICNGSVNQVITGNRIVNNQAVGIGFIGGGAGSRVENNVITGNTYGLEYDSDGGDLGGGPRNSAGGNVISCNVINDIWSNRVITISAMNNFWDHIAPSGNDLFTGGAATIITTGARLATPVCN